MRGQVRNMGGLVQLILTDEPERIDDFLEYLITHKPRASEIIAVERKDIDLVPFDGFSIAPSSAFEDEIAILPSDIAICDRCLAEFRDPANRRYRHPFISCTDCGPRFTIMESLPYDRDTTTMDDFEMCEACAAEYTDGGGIRFHAQTVSCNDCGPLPIWIDCTKSPSLRGASATKKSIGGDSIDAITAAAVHALTNGGVIGLKGVGGYYFACRADSESVVQRLRDIKLREEKPFAVMFGDSDAVRNYCVLSEEESALLESAKRPIVLLERREFISAGVPELAPGVCGSSRFVGAFLPSMGLQYTLTDECGPLVMTSANISGLPIITEDGMMADFAAIEPRLAGVLYNKRRIAAGADDSVVRVIDGHAQLIRRSKGYVPVPVYARGASKATKDMEIFAAGGQLKSAFAISKGNFSYLSQYLGDLDSIESEKTYIQNYERMKKFFGIKPQIFVCDMHPNYVTARFAEKIVESGGNRLIRVQHHHAHIASVMAEHGLRGPVIGVAFDGTGYGTDGRIWGGEILVCENNEFARFSHLRYVKMIGGDSSMKDGWKSALSYAMDNEARNNTPTCAQDCPKSPSLRGASATKQSIHVATTGLLCSTYYDISRKPTFSDIFSQSLRDEMAYPDNIPLSSGNGAEFSIDITDIISYSHGLGEEGLFCDLAEREAAVAALRTGIGNIESSSMGRLFDAVASLLGIHHINRYEGECAVMLENAAYRAKAAMETCEEAAEADKLALAFHLRVSESILDQCRAARKKSGSYIVCISGGVFQNKILMEDALALLRADGFRVYYNELVPPNDGGIALGQNYIGMLTRVHSL
jgi:hydrogenase maturation protein HypF